MIKINYIKENYHFGCYSYKGLKYYFFKNVGTYHTSIGMRKYNSLNKYIIFDDKIETSESTLEKYKYISKRCHMICL